MMISYNKKINNVIFIICCAVVLKPRKHLPMHIYGALFFCFSFNVFYLKDTTAKCDISAWEQRKWESLLLLLLSVSFMEIFSDYFSTTRAAIDGNFMYMRLYKLKFSQDLPISFKRDVTSISITKFKIFLIINLCMKPKTYNYRLNCSPSQTIKVISIHLHIFNHKTRITNNMSKKIT